LAVSGRDDVSAGPFVIAAAFSAAARNSLLWQRRKNTTISSSTTSRPNNRSLSFKGRLAAYFELVTNKMKQKSPTISFHLFDDLCINFKINSIHYKISFKKK
jgi:hypothetical protein